MSRRPSLCLAMESGPTPPISSDKVSSGFGPRKSGCPISAPTASLLAATQRESPLGYHREARLREVAVEGERFA